MAYEITAVMPGSILEVKVEEGQQIEEDQTVLILEAMKMENEIPAEQGGVVKKIFVETGQAVKVGQALIEVE